MLGNIPEDSNYDFPKIPDVIRLSGVTFEDRQNIIVNLPLHSKIELIRDYKNIHDRNAIKVFTTYNGNNIQIGWIPKDLAAILAPEIDAGIIWSGNLFKITGTEEQTKGVLISIFVDELRSEMNG